jgi:bifunctional DNase/RNase
MPADAVALALRTRAPIYATAAALAQARPLARHSAAQTHEQETLARWLEGLRPTDFDVS